MLDQIVIAVVASIVVGAGNAIGLLYASRVEFKWLHDAMDKIEKHVERIEDRFTHDLGKMERDVEYAHKRITDLANTTWRTSRTPEDS